ncbi:MAG TPA: glycosyltransferase family A protein [Sphingomicrobium sp.]|nr:glycosyltransferase family A protein [Sphingomicrobium sp.]
MDQPGAPLVSVVVPAWNAESTIEETLNSVSAQSYGNLEIIIVDDGSTDATSRLVVAYCEREPRARLISTNNGGVARARNRGIEHATGEWIAPIDADDLWHPTKIEKQVAAALAAPEPPGFVYCHYHYIDSESRVVGSRAGWLTNGRAFRQLAYENFVGNGSAPLLRRSAVLAAGGYDPSLRDRDAQGCEDFLLQLIIASGSPVAAVDEFLVGYRVGSETMSRDALQMRRSWELVYDTLEKRGIPVAAKIARRTLASQMLVFSETSFRAGKFGQAIRLLGRALWSDPSRSVLNLGYRGCRLAARLVRGRRRGPDGIPFGSADSSSYVENDRDSLRRLALMVRQFDERRLSKLRELDTRRG